MINPKLGDVQGPPSSPIQDDGNSQTQNSPVFYDGFGDNEGIFGMQYDKALVDGPILLDNPPCLEIATSLCEDKYDKLAGCNDTLIHESPISFLNSTIYSNEEKYALCEKYMHGLKLSNRNSTCNHDANDDTISCNNFERGKHAIDCHDNFNDPLHTTKSTKLPQSSNYIVNFAFTTCNYYERILIITLSCNPTDKMHWSTHTCFNSFIYKMPMHRKKFRYRCYLIYATWCFLLSFKVFDILIDLITPWDPGILLSCFLYKIEKGRIKKYYPHNMCPS